MNRIVFLLEERSMKTLLDGLLPRLMPDGAFICIPHEGKQDLENGNHSRSFQVMMESIERLFASMQKVNSTQGKKDYVDG